MTKPYPGNTGLVPRPAQRSSWPLALAFVIVGGLIAWAIVRSGSASPSSAASVRLSIEPLAEVLAPLAWTPTPTAMATATPEPTPPPTPQPTQPSLADRYGYCAPDTPPGVLCYQQRVIVTTPEPFRPCDPTWRTSGLCLMYGDEAVRGEVETD